MKTVKIAEAAGRVLDWLAAKAANQSVDIQVTGRQNTGCRFGLFYNQRWVGSQERWDEYTPSTDWSQGGPIIDNIKGFQFKQWLESKPESCCEAHIHNYEGDWIHFGPTMLIAAMRCYCMSRLGEEAEVPKELV